MAKRTASTWVDQELYDRLARIALIDRRSMAEVIAMATEHGLPLLEAEVNRKFGNAGLNAMPSAVDRAHAASAVDDAIAGITSVGRETEKSSKHAGSRKAAVQKSAKAAH